MKLPKEFAGMKFALIEDTHERPPTNKIVSSFETYEELRDAVCVAIFGDKEADLRKNYPQLVGEFESYLENLEDEGFLSFEGDPGLSIGVFNPPYEKAQEDKQDG